MCEAVELSTAERRACDGPLAHSPPQQGEKGDPYARHIGGVQCGALQRAQAMLSRASGVPSGLADAIEAAAVFHDLGKLDPDIQAAFRRGRGNRLKWDHVDAGVARLSVRQDWMAAWLVRAHHGPGLPEKHEHFTETWDRRLRGRRDDKRSKDSHDEQIARTDSMMAKYMSQHEANVGPWPVERRRPLHGLTMRLALSCLVDADHADTAFFDTGHLPPEPPETRWKERLEKLNEYVSSLPRGENDAEQLRNSHRRDFFGVCLNSSIRESIVACEGPVGLGKTTAVTAYLLQRAIDENLRHLIIVAPFTNILTQTAKYLRKALVLAGERPDQVIVEHHHRADFSCRDDLKLAVLWRAPIILTTAVAFFEVLAACHPAGLRKLHEVPGSAVFLDEAHAALPTKLWPQNWKWVKGLADSWGCRFVLASGSLARFWEHPDIIQEPVKLPELLPPEQATIVMGGEKNRVRYTGVGDGRILDVPSLVESVRGTSGPRLIILNTVQNAAVVAHAMRESGLDVLHLSTALTPPDRECILEQVKRRLGDRADQDWALIATSCVEAGVNLSFRCAFRERFCTASTIQVGGRVNRNSEYASLGGGIVYDFALDGEGITQHPGAKVSAGVLLCLMTEDQLNRRNPADVVTEAMSRELRDSGGLPADMLMKAEAERNYPKVADLGRVIDADTRFVVIDERLKNSLIGGVTVDFKTLLEGSVQIWARNIRKLALEPLSRHGRASQDIYSWPYDYDPKFLGYMKGVLKLREFLASGGAVI